MRIKLSPSILATLLTASTAFAQFEGMLEMKMTMTDKDGAERGGGTMDVAISKAGMRSEMNMQVPQMGGMGMKMVMLKKTDTPDTMYRINDAAKTYSEMNVPKPADPATPPQDKDKWTIEKLGQEKVVGYQTQHILAKPQNGAGQPMEMWVAKDFLDYATFSKLQGPRGRMGDAGLMKALKDAGTEGMPLKSVVDSGDGGKVTMEVVKAEKKSLPASTFEIPAGYTKSAGGPMDMMGGMSGPQGDAMKARMDAARKRMEEQMKNMTPEQREMMEKMMKQHSGAPQ